MIGLLEEHLADMYETSPPESVHALDLDALKSPEITFFSAWKDRQLLGCVAIKELDSQHAELKSMRTSQFARNTGVASQLLQHVLDTASNRQYQRISLETGSEEYFKPARNLYEKFGFGYYDRVSNYAGRSLVETQGERDSQSRSFLTVGNDEYYTRAIFSRHSRIE